MSNSRLSFILLNLILVGALLALAWYQTHGGPVILPQQGLLFAIVAVYPLTSLIFVWARCGPGRSKTPGAN